MAFTMTTKGVYSLLNTAWASGSTTPDLRMIVFKGTALTTGAIQDLNTIADAIATTLDEATATGYTRANANLDLTITVTEDDTGNLASITAPAPTLTSVASGETWTCVGYYIRTTGADTDVLIGIDVPTPSTLATNGQNITLPALLLNVA
jgi:hypothetical protein